MPTTSAHGTSVAIPLYSSYHTAITFEPLCSLVGKISSLTTFRALNTENLHGARSKILKIQTRLNLEVVRIPTQGLHARRRKRWEVPRSDYCAHRASILRSKIDARLGGRLAVIRRDAIEKKDF